MPVPASPSLGRRTDSCLSSYSLSSYSSYRPASLDRSYSSSTRTYNSYGASSSSGSSSSSLSSSAGKSETSSYGYHSLSRPPRPSLDSYTRKQDSLGLSETRGSRLASKYSVSTTQSSPSRSSYSRLGTDLADTILRKDAVALRSRDASRRRDSGYGSSLGSYSQERSLSRSYSTSPWKETSSSITSNGSRLKSDVDGETTTATSSLKGSRFLRRGSGADNRSTSSSPSRVLGLSRHGLDNRRRPSNEVTTNGEPTSQQRSSIGVPSSSSSRQGSSSPEPSEDANGNRLPVAELRRLFDSNANCSSNGAGTAVVAVGRGAASSSSPSPSMTPSSPAKRPGGEADDDDDEDDLAASAVAEDSESAAEDDVLRNGSASVRSSSSSSDSPPPSRRPSEDQGENGARGVAWTIPNDPPHQTSRGGGGSSSPTSSPFLASAPGTSNAQTARRSNRTTSVTYNNAHDAAKDGDVIPTSPQILRRYHHDSAINERGGLVGLRNIGNTCFMNSVIQCLSNTKPLLEYLLRDNYLSEINTSISSMKGALIKAFGDVIRELWKYESDDRVVNTTAFKSQVQRFAPRFMGYSQQDAQEFLRYLLEGLHEDVNRVTIKPKSLTTDIDEKLSDHQKAIEAWKRYLRFDDSKVVDIFVGQLKSTLQCTVCGHCSVTFDPFWDLSLSIPSRTGQVRLQQCFDLFAKEEVLDGDEKPTCSQCQMRRKCTKRFSIHKFPKILVLHLKRFSPMERYRGKLNSTVDFPLTGLDLSAYAATRSQGCMYNLYGVANHSGTTYSGHYTAYCKHPFTGDWHEYNDSRVSILPVRSIVTSEAYLLFYELVGHSSHL